MMRRVLVIGAGLALFAGAPDNAQGGKQMLRACEMLRRGIHLEGSTVYLPPGSEANQCWGFITAVQQFAVQTEAWVRARHPHLA